MQGILDLPGLAKQQSWPLYFCIRPDAEAAARMLRARDSILSTLAGPWRPTGRERLHLSLLHVESAPRIRPAARYAAIMAARRIAVSPFEACCRETVSFAPLRRERGSALVLRVEGPAIADLQRQLHLAMARPGCALPMAIAPHVTLARGPQQLPPRAIGPIRFTVRDVALVWSAERYQVVEIFPLGG